MTSIFGGAQTVPTTQSQATSQNFNQTTLQEQLQNQATAQNYMANPEAQRVANFAASTASGLYGYSPPVPSLNIAPLTSEQQTGIGALTNQGYGVGNALLPAGQNALLSAGQALTPGDINQFLNPYQDYVTQNLQDIFNQQNLAARVGGVSSTGGVGGDRAAVAQALLGKQQGLAAGQTYAGLYQSALQAAQQQKAQQLQAGQAALQGGFGALGQGLQAASIPQAQRQAELQAQYQQALGVYQEPYLKLAAFTGATPAIAGLGGTGTSIGQGQTTANIGQTGAQTGFGTGQGTTTYPAPSPLSQIAGLGSLALGVGSLFSDRRDKTDIQKVGKDKGSGLPMYAYRYKGDPKTYPKVVGPMAQDVKKKYPEAIKEFARGGGIPHFQYGGEVEQQYNQQAQDTNYLDNFTDVQPPSGGMTTPYASEGSTWDPKRIFSPDRLGKTMRAIAMAQKAAGQAQIAQPRVSQITFPQTPWKMGGGYQRGGRLAIHFPSLHHAISKRMPLPAMRGFRVQEGGRVDAATADSWGGYKVWRPGIPKFGPVEDRYENGEGAAFTEGIPDKAVGLRTPMRMVRPPRYKMPNYEEYLKRRQGPQVYQDGGEVEDPFPEGESEPPGLPEYEDMPDEGDALDPVPGITGVPLPTANPLPSGVRQQAGAFPSLGGGAAPAGGGGMSLFGRPVSPGAMALIQAGLGMLAASGQRDARGLPMSGLAAIGKGGAMGMESLQTSMEQQRKDLLARDTLAQRNMLAQQSLAMRERAQERLEAAAEETRRFNRAREANWAIDKRRPVKMFDPNTGEEYLVRPDTGERVVPPPDPYAVPPASAGPGVIEPKVAPETRAAFTEGDDEGDQEFLATLPEERRAYLAKINRGELPLPPRTRQTIPVLTQLARAYPGFDATVWKSRNETRAAFAKGVEGRSVTALGTLAGHLNDFMDTSQALAKKNVKAFNKVENAVKDQLGGTALADYRVARTAVADELARVFQGAGAVAEAEKDRWLDALDDAKTPEQMRRVIGRLTSLVDSRMKALGQTYDRGMNYRPDNPKSRVSNGWLEGEPKDKFEAVRKWSTGAAPFEEGAGTKFKPPKDWMWSPSRKQYRDPSGAIYDENGNRI